MRGALQTLAVCLTCSLTACRLGLKATNAGLHVCTESKNEFLIPPPSQPAKILTMRMFTRRKKKKIRFMHFTLFLFLFFIKKNFFFI